MNVALLVTVAGPILGAGGWFSQIMWLFWIGVAVCTKHMHEAHGVTSTWGHVLYYDVFSTQ